MDGSGNFGVVQPTKRHCESVLRCTLEKSITVSQRHCCSGLQCSILVGCHITLCPREKSTPATRSFVKIL